jgi:membrane-associated HD superfamily phosphohydrolase
MYDLTNYGTFAIFAGLLFLVTGVVAVYLLNKYKITQFSKNIVLLFTLLEATTLSLWIILVYIGLTASSFLVGSGYMLVAFLELFVGLLIEHNLADVAGRV